VVHRSFVILVTKQTNRESNDRRIFATQTGEEIMRKIIAITHVTLDGIMQAPGGPEEDPRGGFTHGGWAMRFDDAAADEALGKIMSGEFDLLLGRRTYEIFAAYWPYAGDNPIAKAFNKATKHVVTHTLDRFAWAKSQPIGGNVVDEIQRLKTSDGPELHIWGSGEVLQTLIAADLVDEFRVWIYPLILGTGKRLFENGVPPRGLTLVESRTTPTGVLLNTYRPAAPLLRRSPDIENPSEAELARRTKLAAEETQR
jgi:dihydrofolate reductase